MPRPAFAEYQLARPAGSNSHCESADSTLHFKVLRLEIGRLTRKQNPNENEEHDASADETDPAGERTSDERPKAEDSRQDVARPAEPGYEREDGGHVQRGDRFTGEPVTGCDIS